MTTHQRLVFLGLLAALKNWQEDLTFSKQAAHLVYHSTTNHDVDCAIDDFLDDPCDMNADDVKSCLRAALKRQ